MSPYEQALINLKNATDSKGLKVMLYPSTKRSIFDMPKASDWAALQKKLELGIGCCVDGPAAEAALKRNIALVAAVVREARKEEACRA